MLASTRNNDRKNVDSRKKLWCGHCFWYFCKQILTFLPNLRIVSRPARSTPTATATSPPLPTRCSLKLLHTKAIQCAVITCAMLCHAVCYKYKPEHGAVKKTTRRLGFRTNLRSAITPSTIYMSAIVEMLHEKSKIGRQIFDWLHSDTLVAGEKQGFGSRDDGPSFLRGNTIRWFTTDVWTICCGYNRPPAEPFSHELRAEWRPGHFAGGFWDGQQRLGCGGRRQTVTFHPYVEGVMRFQPGQSGNPGGRRKGSVGGRALAVLDKMLTKSRNRKWQTIHGWPQITQITQINAD